MEQFVIGQQVDFINEDGIWQNGEITQISDSKVRLLANNYKEDWVERNRVLKQWVEVYVQQDGKFKESRVIDIDSPMIKVHFKNQTKQNDIWVDLNSSLVKSIRKFQKEYRKKNKSNNQPVNSKETNYLKKLALIDNSSKQDLKQKEEEFIGLLERQGLFIKLIETDGNCLFRAISEQMYGVEKYHRYIRKLCMEYIEIKKDHFQDFVAMKIEDYIEHKKNEGVWGDDLEIQALSEIYQKNILIYCYDVQPIKRIGSIEGEVIRLSYHCNSHYNSIKKRGVDRLTNTEFGKIEETAIQKAKQTKVANNKGSQNSSDSEYLQSQINQLDQDHQNDDYIQAQMKQISQEQEKEEQRILEKTVQESKQQDEVLMSVVQMGISIELAEQVRLIVGNDSQQIINYIYDNLLFMN